MSSTNIRNNIVRVNQQIGDLLKKQASERSKEVELDRTINNLQNRALKSTSSSSNLSYLRQIETKSKELARTQKRYADYHNKIAVKRKELYRYEEQLGRALEAESKKARDKELRFLREKERIHSSEVRNVRDLNLELNRQLDIFKNYSVAEEELQSGGEQEFSLTELNELHKRIDNVLERLEKLGFGQEIIFNEIEELKSKARKVSKKDLKMMLIGKIMSFGAGKIDSNLAAKIFEEITQINTYLTE